MRLVDWVEVTVEVVYGSVANVLLGTVGSDWVFAAPDGSSASEPSLSDVADPLFVALR